MNQVVLWSTSEEDCLNSLVRNVHNDILDKKFELFDFFSLISLVWVSEAAKKKMLSFGNRLKRLVGVFVYSFCLLR